MDEFTQTQLQQMLTNPNNYQNDIQPLLTLIKDGNDETFEIFIQAITSILSSNKEAPLTKLTTLRLLKDTFVQGNVEYLQELNPTLIQIVLQIASYNTNFQPNPENKKEGRGDLYFIQKQNKPKDSKTIRYGNMYVNFAAQIICGFGRLYPKSIQGQSSIFDIALKQYKKVKGPVPPQKFFMAEDQKKFKQNLREWVKKYESEAAQREKQETQKKNNREIKAETEKESQRKSIVNKESATSELAIEAKMKQRQTKLKEEQNIRVPSHGDHDKIRHNIQEIKIQEKQKNDEAVFILPEINQTNHNKTYSKEEKDNKKKQEKKKENESQDKRNDYFKVRAMDFKEKKQAIEIFQGKDFEKSSRRKQFWVAEISQIARPTQQKQKQEVKQTKKVAESILEKVAPKVEKPIEPQREIYPKKTEKIKQEKKKTQQSLKQIEQIDPIVAPTITVKSPIQPPQKKEQATESQKLNKFYETKIEALQKRLGDLTKINNQYLTIIMNQLQYAQKQTQVSTPKNQSVHPMQKLQKEEQMPKKKNCYKTQKSRLKLAKTTSEYPINPYKQNSNSATSSSIHNSKNVCLYRTEIKHLQNSHQLLKNTNNIKMSVFPHLKEYFAPLKCGQNQRFRKCCFLEPGDEKLFFEDQGIQIYIMKMMNYSHKLLVANTNEKTYNVKIFSESSQITLRESSCLIGSREKVAMSVEGDLVNLNFRFPVFNIAIQSEEEQTVYRIPVPITLLSFTILAPAILSQKPEFLGYSLNETQTKVAKKSYKSVPLHLGPAFRDLKRLFPAIKFTRNTNGQIQATGNLHYYFIPQISLKILFNQNQSTCTISTQFEIDDRKPNEAFSKVILQVLMYLLS